MHTITTFRLNPNQKNTNMNGWIASGIRSKISGLSYEKGVKLPGALFHKHDETYIQNARGSGGCQAKTVFIFPPAARKRVRW